MIHCFQENIGFYFIYELSNESCLVSKQEYAQQLSWTVNKHNSDSYTTLKLICECVWVLYCTLLLLHYNYSLTQARHALTNVSHRKPTRWRVRELSLFFGKCIHMSDRHKPRLFLNARECETGLTVRQQTKQLITWHWRWLTNGWRNLYNLAIIKYIQIEIYGFFRSSECENTCSAWVSKVLRIYTGMFICYTRACLLFELIFRTFQPD